MNFPDDALFPALATLGYAPDRQSGVRGVPPRASA
jgi:hypothetical protein